MRTWYFWEMVNHRLARRGLCGSLRVNFPSENVDPRESRHSAELLFGRIRTVRRSRAGHHGERAPQHRPCMRSRSHGLIDHCP